MNNYLFLLKITAFFLTATVWTACQEPCPYDADPEIKLAEHLCGFVDHPKNPLIEPPNSEFLLGDPTVVHSSESPDGKWHLFGNGLKGIYHFRSDDGLSWTLVSEDPLFGYLAFRAYIYREGPTYYLFFEKFSSTTASTIQVSQSSDLSSWTPPKTVLSPSQSWEKETTTTVGNPYVRKQGNEYWLYYSTSGVWLADAAVYEPKYISRAVASSVLGPYKKRGTPIIAPSKGDPLHNFGAGSIKLLDHKMGGKFIALNNGIYKDSAGKNRSAIAVLASDDGLSWEKVCDSPVITPGGDGWKKALVYAFDSVTVGDQIWVYYNARDGWNEPSVKERIGLSTLTLPCNAP